MDNIRFIINIVTQTNFTVLIAIISILITILSLIFAIYQFRKFSKLKKDIENRQEKRIEYYSPRKILEKRISDTYITEIELKNIRCFQNLRIDLHSDYNNETPTLWTVILGDNSAGKTTLLRSIALGLCMESDAISLMKQVSGEFVRKGEKEGEINITLQNYKSKEEFKITTRILKRPRDGSEILRQDPTYEKYRSNIFVCGYGAQRSGKASSSFEKYNPKDAVQLLFNYEGHLQNPEIILLRQDPNIRKLIERKLLNILMLEEQSAEMNYLKSGLELRGPWGNMEFDSISDGYRSTSIWLLDFLSWSIYAGSFSTDEEIGGIILIDELEQHLHPKWQRYIIQRLHTQFAKTQFFASTHTPLLASGAVDLRNSIIFRLSLDALQEASGKSIDKRQLEGKRADQILSEAFGLITSRSPGSIDDLNRYGELFYRKRNSVEEMEFQILIKKLNKSLFIGENTVEQLVEKAVMEVLENTLKNPPSELVTLTAKKKIKELFNREKKGEKD